MRSEERARVERIRDHMIEDLIEQTQVLQQRVTLLERCLMAHHSHGGDCPICAQVMHPLDSDLTGL